MHISWNWPIYYEVGFCPQTAPLDFFYYYEEKAADGQPEYSQELLVLVTNNVCLNFLLSLDLVIAVCLPAYACV